MLNKLSAHTSEEKAVIFLYGINTIIHETDTEYQEYISYKNNLLENIEEDKILSMETLLLLENLGYDLKEIGTYLYKDLIVKAIKELKIILTNKDKESYDILIQELKNPYSNFYHEIARNEKDIGIKTFHAYIIKSISKIDKINENVDLIQTIYGNVSKDLDYKENSLLLATYLLNHQVEASIKKPITRKLIGQNQST